MDPIIETRNQDLRPGGCRGGCARRAALFRLIGFMGFAGLLMFIGLLGLNQLLRFLGLLAFHRFPERRPPALEPKTS
jgi:hypothetical protein